MGKYTIRPMDDGFSIIAKKRSFFFLPRVFFPDFRVFWFDIFVQSNLPTLVGRVKKLTLKTKKTWDFHAVMQHNHL